MADYTAPVTAHPHPDLLAVAGNRRTVTTPVVFSGGTPWWEATDRPTLVAAINAAVAAGGGDVRVAVELPLGADGVTVPNGVSLTCVGQGALTYTGTGAAVTFDSQTNSPRSEVRVRRTSIGWNVGNVAPDLSSVGVRLRNCIWGEYVIHEAQNFETGILLLGDLQGCAYNSIRLGRVNDNKRNIRFQAIGDGNNGFANENKFFGGVIRISNYGGTAGTQYIDLSQTGNNNVWFGTCLEGSAPERVVDVISEANMWIGCRMEDNDARPGSWRFRPTALRNMVFGGYGNFGPFDPKFLDETVPRQNIIVGSQSQWMVGTTGKPAITLQALASNADALVQALNLAGGRTFDLTGGGQYRYWVPGEAHPRIYIDPSTGGPGGYGGVTFGRGNVAPNIDIGVTTNGFGLATRKVFTPLVASTVTRPSAVSAGQGAQMFDSTLNRPIWSDGAVWRTADGLAA